MDVFHAFDCHVEVCGLFLFKITLNSMTESILYNSHLSFLAGFCNTQPKSARGRIPLCLCTVFKQNNNNKNHIAKVMTA